MLFITDWLGFANFSLGWVLGVEVYKLHYIVLERERVLWRNVEIVNKRKRGSGGGGWEWGKEVLGIEGKENFDQDLLDVVFQRMTKNFLYNALIMLTITPQ